MAEMTIRLRNNPETGKKDIIVDLSSDDDALPHEHEQRHRALVQKLVEGGLVQAEELGQIVVERESAASEPAAPRAEPATVERPAQAEGNA